LAVLVSIEINFSRINLLPSFFRVPSIWARPMGNLFCTPIGNFQAFFPQVWESCFFVPRTFLIFPAEPPIVSSFPLPSAKCPFLAFLFGLFATWLDRHGRFFLPKALPPTSVGHFFCHTIVRARGPESHFLTPSLTRPDPGLLNALPMIDRFS